MRGAKKVAKLDVTTPEGLRTAFQNGLITRAGALGRVAEFYDPVGWFEPLKLQMGTRTDTVLTHRLKACHAPADAEAALPPARGRPRVARAEV